MNLSSTTKEFHLFWSLNFSDPPLMQSCFPQRKMILLSKLVGMWNYDFFTVTKIDMKRQQTSKKKAFVHVLILKISVTKMLLLIRFVLLRKNESHLWKQSWTLIITGIHLYSNPNLNSPITDKEGSKISILKDFTHSTLKSISLRSCVQQNSVNKDLY